MKVIFAPDWREGVPYQRLLAEALEARGVSVAFVQGYRRVLPLARALRDVPGADLLHLHWPEAFYPPGGGGLDWLRAARFPLDLSIATRRRPMVLTAHNFLAHNRADEWTANRSSLSALKTAKAIIAHSRGAAETLEQVIPLPACGIHVIPHGDLSEGAPELQASARTALGMAPGPLFLMFGTVEPYKGIQEVLEFWQRAKPQAQLAIVGRPCTEAFGLCVAAIARGISGVHLRLEWQDDASLARWLSAADVAIFNYRTIFTSGAACLARSMGLPLLIPHRLGTVDLLEPDPRVLRFESITTGFTEAMRAGLAIGPDYMVAEPWRTATAWPGIAERTEAVYRQVLEQSTALIKRD